MTESKHVLTSKIFMGGAIGLLANLITSLARHYGYDVVISSEVQLHLNTVVLGLIAYWRNRPTKALHVKKPKELGTPIIDGLWKNNAKIASDRLKADKK